MINKRLAKIIIIIALVLLFPIPIRYKDGGTIKYQAALYSVMDYHALRGVEGFDTGIEIKVFGKQYTKYHFWAVNHNLQFNVFGVSCKSKGWDKFFC